MTEILSVRNLSKKYHQQSALTNINLTIRQGEIYGLIGRNGAGKTTLLKAITSLTSPTEGDVQLFGSQNHREHIRNLDRTGSVIEAPVAFDSLTAEQNLRYYCKLRGILENGDIEKILEMVDLTDTGNKKFKNFSLGMKQKLGIAIALIGQPDLLILDEPINGLDPIAIIDFRKIIQRLNQELGITMIISSHILSELYHVATTFGIIHKGRLVKELTKKEFETICDENIHIKVDDTEKASFLLMKADSSANFKIVDQQTIKIYDFNGNIPAINKMLVENDVAVCELYEDRMELETYFTKLISTSRL